MCRLITATLVFVLVLATACAPSIIKHEPRIAAESAEGFAEVAFVKRDFSEAVRYVEDGASIDEMRDMVGRLHPSGNYPLTVTAVTYEPMQGMESMKIYLEGAGADRSYHYLAIMEGTESKGYKVSAVSRSDEPFPRTDFLKPLR